jgi:hypothetical protein
LPRTAFYDPPAPLRWGPLGQLIRQQTVSVYQVRGKIVTATRIMTVDYRTYPGLGHDTIPGQITGIDDGAMPDILSWITDRFAGRSAPSTCNP